MPEAISAINLAGQFAPDNPFVQRTAGEIIAWYDADPARYGDNSALPGLRFTELMPRQAAVRFPSPLMKKPPPTRASVGAPFGSPSRVEAAEGFVEGPCLSPDEKSLYYLSERSGTFNVWQLDLASPDHPVQVTTH